MEKKKRVAKLPAETKKYRVNWDSADIYLVADSSESDSLLGVIAVFDDEYAAERYRNFLNADLPRDRQTEVIPYCGEVSLPLEIVLEEVCDA